MKDATSAALKYCVLAGISMTAAGLALSEHDLGVRIMWAGLLILIGSPFIGVIVTHICLTAERDWKWAKISAALIAVISIGLLLSLLKI